jgi:threonine synthase
MTAPDPLSLGEGGTPVLPLVSLARHCGVPELWGKAEWRNPTGSYKDRIALETVRVALRRGRRGWIGTSSGNGGAAMSAYGARAGLPGFLCVPLDAPREKLQSIVPYGATVLPMRHLGIREMDAIGELALEYQLQLAVTAYRYNPEGMRGAEAIGAELLDQGPFSHVYVPTGGGGLLVAIARGLGHSSGAPVVVCAQPGGCAPVALHLEGRLDTPEVESCTSAVSGLQLPAPPDGPLAADATRDRGGWGCCVTDEETWEMQELLAQLEGIFVEPASALAVAAVVQDFRAGRLGEGHRPVAILTGSGLKDLRRFAPPDDGRGPSGVADLSALLAATFPGSSAG